MPVLTSTQTRTANDAPLYVPMDGKGNARVSGNLRVLGSATIDQGLSVSQSLLVGGAGATVNLVPSTGSVVMLGGGGALTIGDNTTTGTSIALNGQVGAKALGVGTLAGPANEALFANNGIYGPGTGVAAAFPAGLVTAKFGYSSGQVGTFAAPLAGVGSGTPTVTLGDHGYLTIQWFPGSSLYVGGFIAPLGTSTDYTLLLTKQAGGTAATPVNSPTINVKQTPGTCIILADSEGGSPSAGQTVIFSYQVISGFA